VGNWVYLLNALIYHEKLTELEKDTGLIEEPDSGATPSCYRGSAAVNESLTVLNHA
jgi:hypothetical protein